MTFKIKTSIGDEYEVYVEVNHRKEVRLMDTEDGSCLMRIDCSMIQKISDGHIGVKNYSENTGILQQLIDNGVVSDPVYYVAQGWVNIPICKLLV